MNNQIFVIVVGAIDAVRKLDLPKQRDETIARWYNELNSYQWPQDLPGKPEGWENMSVYAADDAGAVVEESKFKIIEPLQSLFKSLVGERACLKYHHIYNLNRTDEMFETWWERRQARFSGA